MISKQRVLAVLGGVAITFALANSGGTVRAQTWCDPNYASTVAGCVPGDRDYDCWELQNMGIGDIPVVGTDWQNLDGPYDGSNPYEPDGLGCEWY